MSDTDSDSDDGDTKTYYHYTNEEALEQILEDGVIKESTDTVNDAAIGPGVYLTEMDPDDNSKEDIARNNYDSAWEQPEEEGKIDFVIELQLPDDNVETMESSRDVSVHRGDIDLSKVDYTVKEVLCDDDEDDDDY